MAQRPSVSELNGSCGSNGANHANTTSGAVQTISENIGIATAVDSDDDVQFVEERLQPITAVNATIDLCVSPSTSAAAAAASTGSDENAISSSALKNATEPSIGSTTYNTDSSISASNIHECPICLQTCIHPARLPCGHIFCFLCVKGVAYKNRRCAMCRREIPAEFLDHPQLVNGIDDIRTTKSTEDGYQWYYEGRNGWWQYDDRTSQDIEEAYKKGDKSCTILVAGYVYIVDLEALVQQRQNEPSRCRRVKRDLATIPKKGVAGLRIEGNIVTTDTNFAMQIQQQQELPQQHSLRINSADFISTIVATDAAIRIASDIIGSTLAHADELTRGLSAHNAIGSSDEALPNGEHLTTNSTTTSTSTTANHLANLHYNNIDGAAAAATSPMPPPPPPPRIIPFNVLPYTAISSASSAVASESNLNTIQDLMRSATEDLLGTTQQVIETNQHSLDLFEQALNDFQAFSLRNIMDSSEEEPDDADEMVMTAPAVAAAEARNVSNAASQQRPNDKNVNRSLRF